MKLRQLAFTLHRYIGVMLGLLLVLIGLTGSLLIFGNEIDRFLNPQLLQVPPQGQRVSIESVLKTAQQTYLDQKPGNLWWYWYAHSLFVRGFSITNAFHYGLLDLVELYLCTTD